MRHPTTFLLAILATATLGQGPGQLEPHTYSGYHDSTTGTPFPMQHNDGPIPTDCSGCLSYLEQVRTIDTMMQASWQLWQLYNRHWHPDAPAAGQTHTAEELLEFTTNVMLANTFRLHRLVGTWMAATGLPPRADTIPCAWTCDPWGPCVDGVSRRMCVSNGHCHIALDPWPPLDSLCEGQPPPPDPEPIRWGTDFTTVPGTCNLVPLPGSQVADTLKPTYGQGYCPSITAGIYTGRAQGFGGYNERYDCSITAVRTVVLFDYADVGGTDWRQLAQGTRHSDGANVAIRRRDDGSWMLDVPGWEDPTLTARQEGTATIFELPEAIHITSLLGPNPMAITCSRIELRP